MPELSAASKVSPSYFDVAKIRRDFPILNQQVRDRPLVYLDNAATAQKPSSVIEALTAYYKNTNANIHRGIHILSEQATMAYEQCRMKIQAFTNAHSVKEIIFVRGATEAINLVAQSYGRSNLKPGDEIIISVMEHHSNIVPWQLLCEQTGAVLKVIPINQAGELILEAYKKLLNPRTKIVAVSHVSNALGTINPVKHIVELAHVYSAVVLIDGAQAAPHLSIDVQDIDCDFYVFSGHKLYGPTGIGILYGKENLLERMPPWQGGGDMIKAVTLEKTTYGDLPYKFEAGTPHIAGVIGLDAAIDYINDIGIESIAAYENQLLNYAELAAAKIAGLRQIGTARAKTSILSFVFADLHPHDLGTILDSEGIAIRTGHHCAMPVMTYYQVPATARASLAFYNTFTEIDHFIQAIEKAKTVFS